MGFPHDAVTTSQLPSCGYPVDVAGGTGVGFVVDLAEVTGLAFADDAASQIA